MFAALMAGLYSQWSLSMLDIAVLMVSWKHCMQLRSAPAADEFLGAIKLD